MKTLLDPKLDYIFKNIFGVEKNKKLLISLLNAILRGKPYIKDVKLENTEITKILELDKASRLDVLATTDNGTKVNVEIQCRNTGDLINRAFHYLSAMINGSVQTGQSYNNISVISIWILGENVTTREKAISEAYMTFQNNDKDPYQIMTDKARIIFIELNKFNPKTACQQDMLTAWLSFLKDPIFMNEEFLKMEEVHKAMATLKYISSDDEERAIARIRQNTINDHNSERTVAREEGFEEGREAGLEAGVEQKTREAAINMKSKGFDNKLISECLNISEKELGKLLE